MRDDGRAAERGAKTGQRTHRRSAHVAADDGGHDRRVAADVIRVGAGVDDEANGLVSQLANLGDDGRDRVGGWRVHEHHPRLADLHGDVRAANSQHRDVALNGQHDDRRVLRRDAGDTDCARDRDDEGGRG